MERHRRGLAAPFPPTPGCGTDIATEVTGTDMELPKKGFALPAAPFPPGCGTDVAPEATGTDIELPKKAFALPAAPFPPGCGTDMAPEATRTDIELPLLRGIPTETEPPGEATGFLLKVAIPNDRDNAIEGLEGAPAWFSAPMGYIRGASVLANRRTWLRVPGFDELANPSDAPRSPRADCSGERCDNLSVRMTSTNAAVSTDALPVQRTLGVMGGLGQGSNTAAGFSGGRCDNKGV